MAKTLSRRLCAGAGVLLALTASAAPAHAQAATVASASFSKAEAILGGTSRLAAILTEQQGGPAPAVPRPAALSIPQVSYGALATENRLPSPAVTSGRPDLFGSVALSVRRTPLDGRWRKVARSGVGGAAAEFAGNLRERSAAERADEVNRYVNARVSFVDDIRQYGRDDLWTAAAETLRRGRGDCEDYAIAKLQMLRAAGVADRDLYLVIVKDLVRRSDHAVLAVRAGERMLILDNGSDVIADAEAVRDYRPILTFAAGGAWTHGYRRELPSFRVASAQVPPLAPSGRAD
jgi:predicted transglutaminase-like cysteine proteinase